MQGKPLRLESHLKFKVDDGCYHHSNDPMEKWNTYHGGEDYVLFPGDAQVRMD